MTYEELLYDIPQFLKRNHSMLNKCRKLIKNEWNAKNYTSCLNENMLPKNLGYFIYYLHELESISDFFLIFIILNHLHKAQNSNLTNTLGKNEIKTVR